MKSSYSVFELESGNLAGDYPDIELAMTALVRFQRAHGSAQLADYGLLEIREDGELGESWSEDELILKVNEFAIRSNKLARTA